MSQIYNLIIVDDEFLIREGLMSYHWDRFGFHAIGSASNGFQALELMKNTPVDIVVTDIRMPIMDGLALCKNIHAKYPHCKMILLTGYKDFDYAKEAISIGVYDYLLKPINMRKLDIVLESLRKELDDIHDTIHLADSYQKQLKFSLPLARLNFLNSIISGNRMDNDDISEILELLEMSFPSHCFSCCVIRGKLHDQQDSDDIQSLIETVVTKFILSYGQASFVFKALDHTYDMICILNFQPKNKAVSTHSFIRHVINNVYCEITQVLANPHNDICIGIGNIYKNIYSMHLSYKESLQCLEQRLFYPDQSIFYVWHESVKLMIENMDYPYDCEEKLMYALFENSIDDVHHNLNIFINTTIHHTNKISSKTLQNTISQLLNILIRKLKKCGITSDPIISKIYTYISNLSSILNMDQLRNDLHSIFTESYTIIQRMLNKTTQTYDITIQKAMTYIHQHYQSKITLKDISDFVYLAPSYFSSLFKKSTGMNYIDYLTGYRLKKAKKLLTNLDLKIYEVGQRVGYDDPKYFTETFKKHYGTTPRKCRQTLMNKQV